MSQNGDHYEIDMPMRDTEEEFFIKKSKAYARLCELKKEIEGEFSIIRSRVGLDKIEYCEVRLWFVEMDEEEYEEYGFDFEKAEMLECVSSLPKDVEKLANACAGQYGDFLDFERDNYTHLADVYEEWV